MERDQIYDLMDACIKGLASPVDRNKLDILLKEYPDLQKEFRLRKMEHEALELIVEDDLRSKMASWEEESKSGRNKVVQIQKKRSLWRPLGMAASIALILGLFLFNPWSSPDLQELAMEEYHPNFSMLRSSEGVEDPFSVVRQVLQEDNEREYARATTALGRLANNDTYRDEARYYLGHLAWAQKDYLRASDNFEQVSAGSKLKGEALLYQALALMAIDQKDKAVDILTELSKTDFPEEARAKSILSNL